MSKHYIEQRMCFKHGCTGCHHLITQGLWCVWARISRRKCVFIKPGLGSVKAFNLLYTACMLLINITAKEKEPNTVSKDKEHVGTCSQLCHLNLICLSFQAGLQYATAQICTSFRIFFVFLWADTLPTFNNAQLHRHRGQSRVQCSVNKGFDKIWKTNYKPVNLLMLYILTSSWTCQPDKSREWTAVFKQTRPKEI